MSSASFLEEFSGGHKATANGSDALSSQTAQADNRAAFDEGYNCGWQDGVASVESDEGKQKAALAEALQEIKFTYFEARQHVLKSLRPVLEAMVDTALPRATANSLGAHVIELLQGYSGNLESTAILTCAPQNEAMLREAAEAAIDFPIEIVTEATLAENQVVLHFDEGQSRIDLDATLASIRKSVEEFYAEPAEEYAKHA